MIKFSEKNLKKGILIVGVIFVFLFVVLLISIDGGSNDEEDELNSGGTQIIDDELSSEGFEVFTQQNGNFTIDYPEEFYVSREDGDFVEFSSKDGKVKFSVYSPLWFGDENVYVIYIQPNERLLGAETSEDQVEQGEIGPARRIVVSQRYTDQQNRYERTVIDTQLHSDSSSTRKAFSFEYASQDDYEEYLDEFDHFKRSLEQFAD